MIEVFNQLSIFIAKKNFTKNFWDTEPFLKQTKPKYIKWQQAWNNRIEHYTPRVKPDYDDVKVEGVIETWDTKLPKGTSQIKTIKISPKFGADAVQLYRAANEAHPATTVVKSTDAAENLRFLLNLDVLNLLSIPLGAWKRARRAGPAAPAAPSPAGEAGAAAAAAAAARKTASKATADDTDDEEDIAIILQSSRKRGRKAR
jgi:hypothetical protein